MTITIKSRHIDVLRSSSFEPKASQNKKHSANGAKVSAKTKKTVRDLLAKSRGSTSVTIGYVQAVSQTPASKRLRHEWCPESPTSRIGVSIKIVNR